MKLLLVGFCIFILCSSTTCRRSRDAKIYKGKVIGKLCGNITIQFTDGTMKGQNGWTNSADTAHKIYDHVFKVENPCNWGDASSGSDILFTFVFARPQDCMQCMAYAPTPDTAYSIEVVR